MSQVQTDLEILKKAQLLDKDLYDLEQELAEIPQARAQLQQELDVERTRSRELDETLKKTQLSLKEKEGELGQKEEHIKKLDGQLNQVKTNKEYSALQQEIASLKADNSMLEEDILKLYDEIEAVRDAAGEEKKRLEECEKTFQGREKEMADKASGIESRIAGLKSQRDESLQSLDPDVKVRYLHLISKKNGQALAVIRGDFCGACQTKLRAQVINEVLMGEALVFCESCSRILLPDDEAAG